MTVVVAYPRLHIGLLDMGAATTARYGGAGFAIDGPATVVDSRSSSVNALDGRLDDDRRRLVLSALDRLTAAHKVSAAATVTDLPQAHMGLGSTTALIMAVLQSSALANGLTLPKEALQKLSQRGGASGIGVNSFFTGGFLVDGGHAFDQSTTQEPSEFRITPSVPPIRIRLEIPERWTFFLVVPRGRVWSPAEERDFFERNTPVPALEVFESLALVYHGLVPCVEQGDLKALASAFERLHEIGFKGRELRGQTPSVTQTIADLRRLGVGPVGMSSMGPLVFLIAEDSDGTERAIRDACDKNGAVLLGRQHGINLGHEVRA